MADWVRSRVRGLMLKARDAAYTVRHRGGGRKILVLRQRTHLTGFNGHFLDWVARTDRTAAAMFVLCRVPSRRAPALDDVALVLPWVQDPVKEHHPGVYDALKEIEVRCDERGIPVVNRADAMSNGIKSVAAALLNAADVRTARHVPILNPAEFRRTLGGLSFPILIREDRGHGNPIVRVQDEPALVSVPLETYTRPIAVEYVETRRPDGLYRKYRYVAIGDGGAPRHALISASWEVRARCRVVTPEAVAEEVEFLSSPVRDRNLFRRAREALGLDVVAFDYGYDAAGALIVWEANPAAVWWTRDNAHPRLQYQNPFLERLYQELLSYYLRRAGVAGRSEAAG